MKIFKYIYFQLLLLQLEEYDVSRFIKVIAATRGIPPPRPARKPLVWTGKIKVILAIATTLFLILFFFESRNVYPAGIKIISLSVLVVFYFMANFIFLTAATILIGPIDYLVKEFTVQMAKTKIAKLKNLKIIGVAGSYGKTGMKEILYSVLSQKYNVLKTDKSINTPFAISQIALKKLTSETDIFIVEMGEYYKGDIKNICRITPPDFAVICGINEAHLQRLKTLDNTTSTIFEIVENMKPEGIAILNNKDKIIKNNYTKYIAENNVYLYGKSSRGEFDENLPGYITHYDSQKIYLPILGSYNLDKIDAAIYLGKKMGLNTNEIMMGIKNIHPVPHRLQPIVNKNSDTIIIDDSYNGNPDGVEEAISTLALFKKRRRIYVTPGLVEMGEKSSDIHYNIGRKLSHVADLVILIRNSVTPDIEKGLMSKGYDKNRIIWYESAQETYSDIKNIMKKGDVVLLQNDWPDNYL